MKYASSLKVSGRNHSRLHTVFSHYFEIICRMNDIDEGTITGVQAQNVTRAKDWSTFKSDSFRNIFHTFDVNTLSFASLITLR